jgi:lantibiotic modifying enzyme
LTAESGRIDTTEVFLNRSTEIAEQLLVTAFADGDGQLTWGRGVGADLQAVQDSGIFSGRIGEAVFLAALARETARQDLRDAAVSCCARLSRVVRLKEARQTLVDELSLGAQGLGGIICGLVRVGQFLEEGEMLAAATQLAMGLSRQRLEGDQKLDVFWGIGGLLPSLISLYRAGHNVLGLAVTCGDLLVERRVVDGGTGVRAWRTLGDRPWGGYAHGSCGIAAGLLQLYSCTGEAQYATAAFEAFEFERRILRDDGVWPDYVGQEITTLGWCHGAPGVALSRLVAIENLNESLLPEEIVGDLYSSLSSTVASPLRMPYSLCCGTVGRAAVLYRAANVLANDSLRACANRMLDFSIDRINAVGIGGHVASEPHLAKGFWQGLAGVGYTLLRAANPTRFPCVMSL